MKVVFEAVKFSSIKNGKCSVCGKSCSRAKTFYQTISPFNRNADETIKTRGQIYAEETIKINAWKKIPPVHVKCEAV